MASSGGDVDDGSGRGLADLQIHDTEPEFGEQVPGETFRREMSEYETGGAAAVSCTPEPEARKPMSWAGYVYNESTTGLANHTWRSMQVMSTGSASY